MEGEPGAEGQQELWPLGRLPGPGLEEGQAGGAKGGARAGLPLPHWESRDTLNLCSSSVLTHREASLGEPSDSSQAEAGAWEVPFPQL